MFFPFRKRSRSSRLAEPFPEAWHGYLRDNVFLYQLLSEAEQARLRDVTRILAAEIRWEGCQGLTVTDEIRVTVAVQAGLLLLGFDDYYFDGLRTVLIYPGGFLAEQPWSEEPRHLLGQAHRGGPVVLSWWDARWSGRRLGWGNLVLHEFAHKLAELGDPVAGRPPMDDPEQQRRWEEVVGAEFERLAEDADYDRPTLLDSYGAANRAEFFAVATECFFLNPALLHRRHPELYRVLADWYRQDPAGRRVPGPEEDARAEEAEGEYARHAIAECTAAIRLRPDSVNAYWGRANWHWSLEDYDRAVDDYTAVLRLAADGAMTQAYCDRGATYRDKGDYDAALADFDAAVRDCPRYARAYWERGLTWARRGDPKAALADLDRAVHLDRKDDVAYRERGLVHKALGNPAKALRDFTKAIRLSPYSADAYLHRAEVYLAQGEPERAVADCDEAVQLDAWLAEAYRVRAAAHAALGDAEKAERDRARADELAPEPDQ
jgi:MtfA peptidase